MRRQTDFRERTKEMPTVCIIILLSIFAAIVLGFVTKINVGWFSIAFAFILGCFLAGLSVGKVTDLWPTKLFFQLLSVTFFFAFAVNNGTLELIARKALYLTRKRPFLVPIVMWIIGFVLAGIGPGSVAMMLILSPVVQRLADECDMDPALACISMITGINSGAWSPIAVNGITTKGLMEASGYSAQDAAEYTVGVWGNMIVVSIIMFLIFYVVFRGWRCRASRLAGKPEPFNKNQKVNVTLILVMLLLVLVPYFISGVTVNAAVSAFATKLDITYLSVVFAIIAMFLKLGDEKQAIAAVPWKMIITICGVGMLVAVASEAGTMAYLSEYIGRSFSPAVLPFVMALISGVMSLFSSTMGVVIPTLYPLIYAICTASGASPLMLFSVVPIASGYTGISPFSSVGGMSMANIREEKYDSAFIKLLISAFATIAISLLCIAIGIIR